MLRITRTRPPQHFFNLIEEPRDVLLDWARRDPAARRQRRAPINHDLFHSGMLVQMVTSEFDGRCAYCERPVGAASGNASHYRPLALSSEESTPEFADHYSWLAYEWLNLILICRRCERARRDRFPVADYRARFLATPDEVRAEERPHLLDPARDNPFSHLSYLISGECFPKPNSLKGKVTVQIFDLNDDELVDARRDAISSALQSWSRALKGEAELPNYFLQSVPHAGACRDVLRRTLSQAGQEDISPNSGPSFLRRLRTILAERDPDEAERLISAIDLVDNADRIRRAELLRRPALPDVWVGPVAMAEEPSQLPPSRGPLRAVEISNFRAIDQLTIPFHSERSERYGAPCMLLLGENAVGKSTSLAAIALALIGTRQARRLRLDDYDLARSTQRGAWDVWGKGPADVRVYFHDRHEPAAFHYDPTRRVIEGTYEQSTLVLGYGPHRYFKPARGDRRRSPADAVRSLFDSRHPINDPADWLIDLSPGEFNQVARTVRTILPIGDDDELINDRRAGICVSAQGQLTKIAQLSEGYRSIFAMVADMCRSLLDHWSNLEKAEAVVLIDEIETHLHPRWKMQVMSSLRSALPAVQFIATTHDPLCVRGMDDGEVLVLARDAEGGVHLLEDLPPVSGMRAEQLLTSEFFGLSSTIDPSVHLEIARMAEGVAVDPSHVIGAEADELVSRITVGDSATAQIVHEALLRYLRHREEPQLATNARAEAVGEVFRALKQAGPRE